MKLKNTIIFQNAEVPLQITSQVFLITRHVLNFERAGLQCFIDAKKRKMLLAKLDGYGRVRIQIHHSLDSRKREMPLAKTALVDIDESGCK